MIKVRNLLKSESGATAIEYGLIAAFVALAIFVGAQMAGNGLNRMFQVIGTQMENAADKAENSGS
ncbi:Flp family type IVb pilin [Dongia sp.]|uniref:Flp family type IVb pilin n=1 Tax=Dongia sp. TaxID=1977262 RepID=UPI0035B3471F